MKTFCRLKFKTLHGRFHISVITGLIVLLLSFAFHSIAWGHTRNLRVVAPWEIKGMDPAMSGIIFQRMEIVETLTQVDHDGKHCPGLATDWKISDDHLQWVFTIREGVKYHDGTPLTAENVAMSLNFALQKPGMLKKMPIKAIDHKANSIYISLSEPTSILDSVLSHYSTAILAPASFTETGEVIKVIATGPYSVASFELPQKIKVKAFFDYWGKVPEIKAAEYLAVARNETRALMAQSGDADVTYTLDPATMDRLERFKRISVVSTSLPRTIVIKLNCSIPGLNTPVLRRALSEGLDRKGIALTVMRDEKSSAYQLFPEALGQWHLDSLDKQKTTGPGFKALMLEQGWTENSQGILEKEGKALEMTIVTYSDRPELPITATLLQDQMRKMGIKLNVSVANSSAIPQGHSEGTLEMGLLARNYGLISSPLGTIIADYGAEGGDWGAMNWKNDQLQDALGTLRRSSGEEKKVAYIRSISTILHEEMPTIPVVFYQHSAALSNDIVGFSLDPLERSYRVSELSWTDKK